MLYVLASQSPRRVELFKEISADFAVMPADVDERAETFFKAEEVPSVIRDCPENLSMKIALKKAEYIARQCCDKVVVGADTGVFIDGEMLGKPKDCEDAVRLLKKLSGRSHYVITGYAICYKGQSVTDFERSKVTFNELSDEAITSYIESGLYEGKAGAYGIQDGYGLVREYDGDLNNIIGFPVDSIKNKLKEMDLWQP